ncbi:hypothetical protein GHT06_003868 [Daphnia sinensis]|uniref:Uncharacterized protein n=1 Tax=Daphnia sinensis TaxID=1820382 RepID=A0AAD5KEX6_9CRUS|nr:hypothetical protein GHT06_003868 [Daphnia sinensis]
MALRWDTEKIETNAQLEHLLDEFAADTRITLVNNAPELGENVTVWDFASRDAHSIAHRIAFPVPRTGEILSGPISAVGRFTFPNRSAGYLPSHPAMGASPTNPFYSFEIIIDDQKTTDDISVMNIDGAWVFWDNLDEELEEMYANYPRERNDDEEWDDDDPEIPNPPEHHPYDSDIARHPGTNIVSIHDSYDDDDSDEYIETMQRRAACHARMPYWTMPALLIESRVSFDPWTPKSRLSGIAYLNYVGQTVPRDVPAGGIDGAVERFQAWWASQLDAMGTCWGWMSSICWAEMQSQAPCTATTAPTSPLNQIPTIRDLCPGCPRGTSTQNPTQPRPSGPTRATRDTRSEVSRKFIRRPAPTRG